MKNRDTCWIPVLHFNVFVSTGVANVADLCQLGHIERPFLVGGIVGEISSLTTCGHSICHPFALTFVIYGHTHERKTAGISLLRRIMCYDRNST